MYIHAGNGVSIRKDGIIGVFDMDNSTESEVTAGFLRDAEKNGKTVNCRVAALPKSFILTEDGTVYISELAPDIINDRSKNK